MIRKRPFCWIFLLFAVGIVLQPYRHVPVMLLMFCGAAGLILASRLSTRPAIFLVLMAFNLILLGGLYHATQRKFPADHIHYQRGVFWGKSVQLEGVVVSDVSEKKQIYGRKIVFVLELNAMGLPDQVRHARGQVLVHIYRALKIEYGDRLIMSGKLHRPYEFSSSPKFSYRRYLAQKGIYWIFSVAKKNPVRLIQKGEGFWLKRMSLRLRTYLQNIYQRFLSPPVCGLMQAIILGERSRISPAIHQLFKLTGTAHILAISGLHVGIVAALFFVFFRLCRLPRRLQYVLTILSLGGYALLTGLRPSVIRAAIMGGIFLSSFVLERETDSLNSLSLAGFILLLCNPKNIFDIGFQLSFASVFAIIILYPRLWGVMQMMKGSPKSKPVKFILQSLAGSVAAWLGVAGLILYYFEIITPVTILANVIVIPAVAVIVALGFGLLLASCISPFLASCFSACIELSFKALLFMVLCFRDLPGAYYRFPNISVRALIFYYGLIFSLFFIFSVFFQKHIRIQGVMNK